MRFELRETTNLQGLSLWDSFWGYISGKDYQKAVVAVESRIRYNQGLKCYPLGLANYCILGDEIDVVLKTYLNMCDKLEIPEYDRKKNPQSITTIEQKVAERSNVTENRVAIILLELYWASIDGTLSNTAIIFPVSWKRNLPYTDKTPDSVSDFDKSVLSAKNLFGGDGTNGFFGNLFTTIKWSLYAGAGVVIVGGTLYAINQVKNLKRIVT